MSEPKPLLVVVTRGYATRGGTNDEFIQEWGLPDPDESGQEVRHVWRNNAEDEVALLVIHGHQENSPIKAIEKAWDDGQTVAPEGIDKKAVWLFYHSIKDNDEQTPRSKIAEKLGAPKDQVKIHAYASGGGSAVGGLLQVFDEGKDEHLVFPKFAVAVEKIATSRRLFVSRLHRLQSDLLRLRLAMEAVLVDGWELNGIEEASVLFEVAKNTHGTVADIFEKDKDWLPLLKKDQSSDDARSAIQLIEKELYRRESAVWSGYKDNGWTNEFDAAKVDAIRTDLAHFARALDVLLEAAEYLPVRLPAETAEKDPP